MDYRKEAIDCVKDHVLPLHKQIYDKYDGDFDRIYSEGYNSKSYQGRVIEPGTVYELSYQECSCPKVKCGLRNNPEQCECSRQSILFILSQLEPESRFDVRIENTILRGGERCTFRITRHADMDIKHHFIEKGQGEPLILLHGNGENCDYFTGQVDAFAKYYHVYALDTCGHGKTPRSNAPFTIRRFAGTKDMVKDEHTRLIANHIPDAQLVILDGDHFVANKCPDAFNRAVLNFLRNE